MTTTEQYRRKRLEKPIFLWFLLQLRYGWHMFFISVCVMVNAATVVGRDDNNKLRGESMEGIDARS